VRQPGLRGHWKHGGNDAIQPGETASHDVNGEIGATAGFRLLDEARRNASVIPVTPEVAGSSPVAPVPKPTASRRFPRHRPRPLADVRWAHGRTQFRVQLWDSFGTRVAHSSNKNPDLRGLLERMMGLEPTTFCMANARDVRARSRPFAQTAWLRGLRPSERTRANPSERRTSPFLPRLARDRDAPVAGSYRGRDVDTFPRRVAYRFVEVRGL
jgi:hypothetical protein